MNETKNSNKEPQPAHIIYTPFTGVGLHGGFRGEQWLEHRIKIFKNYTLKSLMNQSNQDFLHWISFRPEEKNNEQIRQLASYLTNCNYPYIFTFDGLMYWDDKFTDYRLKTQLRNCLMMLWDCWHYKDIRCSSKELQFKIKQIWKYTWENKNKTLLDRTKRSLNHIDSIIGHGFDWIYLTRIDSDDMFHKETVNLIQSEKPQYNKALVFDKGYIYNIQTGQLGEWHPPTNPPFHTIIFPGSTFFNPQSYLEYYKNFRTHEDITRIFNCTTLDMHKYMVSFHGRHISTAWESSVLRREYHKLKYRGYCYTTSGRNISTHWQSRTTKQKNFMIGKEFVGEIKDNILKDFGITIDLYKEEKL